MTSTILILWGLVGAPVLAVTSAWLLRWIGVPE